ncbi:MAG: B12-binding domain-containing radical SAM protein [Chloroflexi bacterium]|nr:B12-binding domain-containing radical SAM protein [Chloroflexota bacterium]
MNILLTNIPQEFETKEYTTPDYIKSFERYPPLGLMAIAADVDSMHTIKILDVSVPALSVEETIEYIREYHPDVLGISVTSRLLYAMNVITHRVKDVLPDTKIVVGGAHVTYFPRETMELGAIDYALPGFGEKTFPLLIEAIAAGEKPEALAIIPNLYYRAAGKQIKSNPYDEPPIVLDPIPFPNRRLINLDDYYSVISKGRMTTLYTSRGCPFHCIFCDIQDKKFRYRTAKCVVDEFEEIANLGIKELLILDDTFNANRKRVIDICNEIIRRGLKISWGARARLYPFDEEIISLLKKAGCNRLHVGVESLDRDILRYMRKGITPEHISQFFRLCKEYDMETLAYFILGFPNETREYRAGLMKELDKLNINFLFFNVLYPLAKTQYYQELLDGGIYKRDYWADFNRNPTKYFELPLPRSPELQQELLETADRLTSGFYLRPKFIWQEFKRSFRSPRALWEAAKVAVSLFRLRWLRRSTVREQ